MAINDIVQTIAEARVDARSLSEFVFKPAGFKVARRLAPPVDTLQFYIDRFNSLNGDFSSSVSAALSSLNSSVAEADGKVAYIETTVQDAINNTAVEGGVLADTFVTATANGIGAIARNMRDVRSERVSVKDYGAIGDGALHPVSEWIPSRFADLADIQATYPHVSALTDSIDWAAIQQAITQNYGGRIHIPYSQYVLNRGLKMKMAITIDGDIRGLVPYSYSAFNSCLLFQGCPADEWALDIAADSGGLSGFGLNNLFFKGTYAINGITIGKDITRDVKDGSIVNTIVYGFKQALACTYLYGATFDGFRAQTCTNGLDLGSQLNQIMFLRCAVVSITNIAIRMSNCESLTFDTCNISNLSREVTPIIMFQSNAVFRQGYFENITSDTLIHVGANSENEAIASTMVMDNALKLGGHIICENANNYVEVRGRHRGNIGVIGGQFIANHLNSIVLGNNLISDPDEFLERYPVGMYRAHASTGGSVITNEHHRNFMRVTNAATAASGIRLTTRMEVGQLYTLSYIIQNGDASVRPTMRMGSGQNLTMFVDEFDGGLTVRHCSFIAEDTTLRMLFAGSIDIYAYQIRKGNRKSVYEEGFVVPSSDDRVEVYATAIPTGTGWLRGDRVINKAPSVGADIGWVCTDAAAQTWVTLGVVGGYVPPEEEVP